MSTLIFFITLIAVFILSVQTIILAYKRQRFVPALLKIFGVILVYAGLWYLFHFIRKDEIVSLGTDVCFDDWCATLTKTGRPSSLGRDSLLPKGQFFVLHIKMSNHARGIAQKPSEPRVHMMDNQGRVWSCSEKGQKAFEQAAGKQIDLAARLELGQSLETQLVFDVPADAKGLKVLIEEGPPITNFLFPEDRQVFEVQ